MTREEKQLLLKDLCARLPYGVKVQYLTGGNDKTYVCNVDQVSIKSQCVGIAEIGHTVFTWRTIDRIKPYLRPMSSMTEEEKVQLSQYACIGEDLNGEFIDVVQRKDCVAYIDWLNKHHFDYRELIKKGLAIAVTPENNPYKE